MTRIEMYLARLIDSTAPIPLRPKTRKEMLLAAVIDAVDRSKPFMIAAESSTSVNGHVAPALTGDQVAVAYNAIVSGRGCIIQSISGEYFSVQQADTISGHPCISFVYYDYAVLTYHDDGTIDVKVL